MGCVAEWKRKRRGRAEEGRRPKGQDVQLPKAALVFIHLPSFAHPLPEFHKEAKAESVLRYRLERIGGRWIVGPQIPRNPLLTRLPEA